MNENENKKEESVKADEASAQKTNPDVTEAKTENQKPASERKELSRLRGEVKRLEGELAAKEKDCAEQSDRYMRMIAEYDNFRKRSQKEHDSLYASAYGEALSEFLPMADNLERSLAFSGTDNFAPGIQLIVNQFSDTLKKLGIEAFGQRGDKFDPNIHNAVMRTDDPTLGEETVAEVLQKGYRKGDRILRHAMVKVAN